MTTTPSKKAARLNPEERIADILVAARTLLSERGYENLLTTDVASQCGVSEATIYRYFPTKRDLLVKVAEDWFTEILAVEPELAKQGDVYHQLRYFIRSSLSIVRKEPWLTRYVLLELRSDPSYRSSQIYALNQRFTSSVVNLVNDAVRKGVFRAGVSAQLVRDMIFGCIEHRTWSYLRGGSDFSVEEAADTIATIIYRGLVDTRSIDRDVGETALAHLTESARILSEGIEVLRGGLGADKPSE